SRAYISDQKALPIRDAPHKLSQIDDENLASAVKDHLQSRGKYVCAQDLVDYSNIPENQALHGFKKGISLTTAQQWMKKLGYWTKDPKGQYVDGHEHEDVVHYRQNVFLPAWIHYQPRMRKWREDDITIEEVDTTTAASGRRVVVWFHDESTFYANDSIVTNGYEGKPVCGPDGKPLRGKIPMEDGWLPNGDSQSLYFPEGHDKAGWFKGMLQILVECGYTDTPNLKAQCKDFKCPGDGKDSCCCRWLMYSQPNFVHVESVLEALCRAWGFDVIFLPKFHCALNFIEQCWGFAKQMYRMKDSSSSAAALKKNVIDSLNAVAMLTMQRFSIRPARFIDAYQKGLNGTQAAWAIKKYHGHHVLPAVIMKEFDDAYPLTTSESVLI
ncbi:hypothetical protein BDR05DRAFT_882039, partial [Suillus weaverae]